jgi:hypothetical protein
MVWSCGLNSSGSWRGIQAGHCEDINEPLGSINNGKYLIQQSVEQPPMKGKGTNKPRKTK